MRILHVISALNARYGGPPMVVSRLATAQAREGHQVSVLCYVNLHGGQDGETDSTMDTTPGGNLVRVHTMPSPSRLEHLLGPTARATVRRLMPDLDVVHLHGPWETLVRVTARAASKRGVPYVLAPHGILDEWAMSEKTFKKKLALKVAVGAVLRGAAFLHALSEYERECLVAGRYNRDVRVIPNGVFLEELEPLPARDSFATKHPVLAGKRYVLFLARLHPVKGLDLLAEAFARVAREIPDVHLVAAGPDFGAEAPLREQIGRLGIGSRVLLPGALWGEDKRAALAGASVFCLPSKHEGFSMSIAEALACRVPVVITDSCHFPAVAEARAGLVIPRTVEAIEGALRRMLTDPQAGEFGRRGRALIESRYTWPRIAEQSVAAYASAMSRRPVPKAQPIASHAQP